MEPQKQITFSNLKPNIADAIKESCQTSDAVIYKIADEVYQIKTLSVEPGVEIAKGLSVIIEEIIKASVKLGCDLSVITKGVMVGAFRSRLVQLEAHKTIRILIVETVQSTLKYKGDANQAIKGILAAIPVIAKEATFNAEEAIKVAQEDIKYALEGGNDRS